MIEIFVPSFDFKPNIIFLKEHIIIYGFELIILYDIKKRLFYDKKVQMMYKLAKINNKNFIGCSFRSIYNIQINNEGINVEELKVFDDDIEDILYIEDNNILILSFKECIKVFNLNLNIEMQTINGISKKLLGINKDLFINLNDNYLSIFKYIKREKIYEKLSNYNIEGINDIIKITSKLIIITIKNNNNLYSLNLTKMKIKKYNLPFLQNNDIKFMYNYKYDIYLHDSDKLYLIKYLDNTDIILIESFELNYIKSISYILNQYHKIKGIVFNCYENYKNSKNDDLIMDLDSLNFGIKYREMSLNLFSIKIEEIELKIGFVAIILKILLIYFLFIFLFSLPK